MRIPQTPHQCSNLTCENCGRANFTSYANTCLNTQKKFNYDGQKYLAQWILTPESSNIARFSYHNDTLTVIFKNGGKYAYFGVPEAIFEEMKGAESKGKFLNSEVKGKFDVQKLEE
jgi:hypothetical protein